MKVKYRVRPQGEQLIVLIAFLQVLIVQELLLLVVVINRKTAILAMMRS